MRECTETLVSEMTEAERRSLTDALSAANLKGAHLEIGTAAGGTLCHLLVHYRDEMEREPPPFIVVDPFTYFPDQLETVRRNLLRHKLDPDQVRFIQATGKEAFEQIASDPPALDFILVDGSHKLRHVVQDLRWARHLRPGGLLCLHDCSPKYPGVWLNARRFTRRHSNYSRVSHAGTLLILRKDAPSSRREITPWAVLRANLLSPLLQLKASLAKRIKCNG